MNKTLLRVFAFTFAFAMAGIAFAAEQTQDAYAEYNQKVAPVEQQLYAKQAELQALRFSPQPDTAKAQQLFKEIGELRGQLFAARMELRSQAGEAMPPYAGRRHRGEFFQGDYEYTGHGGYYSGHGMSRHGGHHGGW